MVKGYSSRQVDRNWPKSPLGCDLGKCQKTVVFRCSTRLSYPPLSATLLDIKHSSLSYEFVSKMCRSKIEGIKSRRSQAVPARTGRPRRPGSKGLAGVVISRRSETLSPVRINDITTARHENPLQNSSHSYESRCKPSVFRNGYGDSHKSSGRRCALCSSS
jgi:hypothetical protein